MARCPECGSGLSATAYRYCPSCEHDLAPAVDDAVTCAGCGARLEHGADAYHGCGRLVGIDGPSRWSGRILLTRLSLMVVAALWGLSLLVEAAALWGVLVFPPLAFLGARRGAERSPVAWLIGLGVPGVVGVLVGGIVLHDPGEGASFWPVSMLFVLVVAGLTAGACTVGTHGPVFVGATGHGADGACPSDPPRSGTDRATNTCQNGRLGCLPWSGGRRHEPRDPPVRCYLQGARTGSIE